VSASEEESTKCHTVESSGRNWEGWRRQEIS
jgi:hypothetical protein